MLTAIKMVKEKLVSNLKIPSGITVSVTGRNIAVSSGANKVAREIKSKNISIVVEGDKIIFTLENHNKRSRTILGTFEAHIKKMFKGVTVGHVYKLKICSGHFPMTVAVSGNQITVKNFLGEKVPRSLNFDSSVKVTSDGNEVIVQGNDIEKVGSVASQIEKLTSVKGRDLRVFQDGIYITEKDGKVA